MFMGSKIAGLLLLLIFSLFVVQDSSPLGETDSDDALFEIKALMDESIVLSDSTEIEKYEWINEEQTCLRVGVQYKEQPEHDYRHKEDLFLFFTKDGEICDMLYVDYPEHGFENMEKMRYTWDACDFSAHLEDVTFDGEEDLLIFLGYQGVHATQVYCAYIHRNGTYEYESSFEQIPNYEVDREAGLIKGYARNSADSYVDYEYAYEDGAFVEKVSINYVFEEEKGDYIEKSRIYNE